MALARGGRCAEEAVADFSTTVSLDPEYEDAYYHKGSVLCYLGRIDEALREYSKAIEIDPNDAANWLGRGDAYYMLARYEEALADYKAAEKVYLSDTKWAERNLIRPYMAQGQTLTKLGRDEAAAEMYAQAIRIDADKSSSAHGYRAHVLNFLGRYEEALNATDKALEISPDSSYAYAVRGDALAMPTFR